MLRTIRTNSTNLDFTLDFGPIRIESGVSQFVEIDLFTKDADDSESAKAIRSATLAEGTDFAQVRVPDRPAQYGSVQGVTFGRRGVQVTNVRGNMTIVGNRVFVDGVEIRPGSSSGEAIHGIEVTIRTPRLANLKFDTTGCDLTHVGDPLGRVEAKSQSGSASLRSLTAVSFKSQSGSLDVQDAVRVQARTQSGSIYVRTARVIDAKSQSGSIEVLGLSGDANADSMSGSVRITALTEGDVYASTMSGDVTVSDPNHLHRRGLSVDMSSMSGRTRLV